MLNRALQRVWAACAAAGKPVGVHATDGAVARRYRDAGYPVTTVVDATAITRDTAAQFSLARASAPGRASNRTKRMVINSKVAQLKIAQERAWAAQGLLQ